MLENVIRVFVSSTFKDMRQERDIFHSDHIQGRIRQLCESYGFQFQLIDLRWGVSEEAGWDQRTEQLCLEEIRRCREISPRPNFVALVGQRYGWRPLPQMLERSDWKLTCRVAGKDLSLLEDWYRPDANNKPFVYRLRARLTDNERDRAVWGRIEKTLHEVLIRSLNQFPQQVSRTIQQVDKSLTEKEVELGAENAEQSDWQAFAYFREIDGQSRDTLDEPFVDRDEHGEFVDPRSSEKLASLRARLEASDTVTTRSYKAHVKNDRVDETYLKALTEQIYEDLSTAITKQLQELRLRDPLDLEIEKHRIFAKKRHLNYVPRKSDEDRIVDYVRSSNSQNAFIVAASSGSGKTAILAQAQQVLAQQMPDNILVTRFIGATGTSSSLRTLVRSIHDEVARATNTEPLSDKFTDEPIRLLGETLRLGTEQQPVVILLDALDQIASDDNARTLNWLPLTIPKYAKLVATVMSNGPDNQKSDVYQAVGNRLPPAAIMPLSPMKDFDLERAFKMWLLHFGRTVSKNQTNKVRKAISNCPRPLFVRVLVELARRWDAEHDPGALPSDIQNVILAVLTDLERDERHGKPIVTATLSKLSASRAGLTEPELVDLLNRDTAVLTDFRARSRYEYSDDRHDLPPIVWSRLLLDLSFFLGQSSATGVGLLDFYHRQLSYAVQARYPNQIKNAALDIANYFEPQPAMNSNSGIPTPNVRRAFELIWQLRTLGSNQSRQRTQSLLTTREFVEAKAQTELVRDLLEDYFQHAEDVNLKSIVRFLADFLVSCSTGAENLAPEVIQSYLAYLTTFNNADRARPNLYLALLEELVTYQLDENASKGAKRRVSRSKISLAEQQRRKTDFEKARRMLKILDDPAASLNAKDLATGWYEKAYVEYVEDNYELAIKYFDLSIDAAKDAGDIVGAMIPYGPRQWASYFVNPLESTLRESIGREKKVLKTLREHELSDPRAERWVRNTLAHLADLHYYLDDGEGMTPYVKEMKNNPWVRNYEISQGSQLNKQYEARYLCAQGQYPEAIVAWRSMFKGSATKRDQERAAWLMHDYGVALERFGQKVVAAQVYLDGLKTPPKGACNAFWHTRIRERLKDLPLEAQQQAQSSDGYVSPLHGLVTV